MSKSLILKVFVGLVLLTVGTGLFRYLRPLPVTKPEYNSVNFAASQAIALPLPSYGQSALAAENYGQLAASGDQTPVSIASVAKIFTAMAVLRQKPLAAGEQGPMITLDKTDVSYYSYYYSNDGSVTKVVDGEQISQYQALQAMLLPSSNNMADSLARWAFGSVDNYVTYANQMVKDLGLNQTVIDSPSGFTPNTKSTANDLVKAGLLGLQNPVFAEIVNQQQADVPVAGTIHNVNWLLGVDGVNGVKTGNTTEAGGCYLFSAKRTILGEPVTIVGAILGAPTRNQAITDARPLITTIDNGFEKATIVKKGQVVGSYKTNWGAKANAIAEKDITAIVWKGQKPTVTIALDTISSSVQQNTVIGKISVLNNNQSISTNAVLEKQITKPTAAWRIFRR